MKSRIAGISLCVLALLAGGFYPLLAQQGSPQPGSPQSILPFPLQNPGGFMTPWGTPVQPGFPNLSGTQATNPLRGGQPNAPMGQMVPPAPGLQPQQPPASLQVSQRACGAVALPQPAAPFSALPGQSQTIPVQGLRPGSGGVPGAGSLQSTGAQAALGQQAGSLGINQPSQFSSQAPGGSYPGFSFYEPVSTIEAAFRSVGASPSDTSKELRQYGYSIFANPVSTFAPVEDVPVGPDYILGPGDSLAINVWGAMDSAAMQTVDRNGQILLPSAGPVRVWGLTFSQADRLIREQLSRYYRGFQTNVTMGRLRTIRVYVVGEVCQPGSYTISSLSTLTNAIFASGGPLKLGSMRKIELKRNHHTVGTIDLYDFLLRGDKTRDFRLESGDTIFIPSIGPIAAIAGEVKRPAIYELQGPTRVTDLIEMAGGLTPQSYLKRVQIIRAKPNAEREIMDVDLTNFEGNGEAPANLEIRNGDLVKIYPTDPRIYNTLSLAGVVKYPGEYEFKPNMRLSHLLPQGSVLPEAYLEGVEVIRARDDLTTEVLHLNLKKAWAGDQTQDAVLRPRDQISVRTELQGPKSVTLQGEVKLAGTYITMPGERLSAVLKRAGGFTDKAFLKGAVFTRRSVQDMERKRLEEFVREQEERLLAERTSIIAGLQSISTSGAAVVDYNLFQKREQIRLVASRVTLGRIVIHLDDLEKFAGTSSDIILENGDTLNIPQKPAAVLVMGSVKNPTAIIHRDAEDIQYYVNRAGGLSDAADPSGMYLLKADGSALTGFLRLKDVDAGDAIIVPPRSQERYDWSWMKDLATMASQTFLTLAALAAIF